MPHEGPEARLIRTLFSGLWSAMVAPQNAKDRSPKKRRLCRRYTYGKGVTGHLALTYITAGIWSTIVRRVRASILEEGGRAFPF